MDFASTAVRLGDYVGVVRRRDVGVVCAADFVDFAYAAGATSPRYLSTAEKHPVAHPIYLSAVMYWGAGPTPGEIRADGSIESATEDLPLNGLRLMGAGQEISFHDDVFDGLPLEMETELLSVDLKHGRQGDLLLLRIRRRFLGPENRPVLTCVEAVIAR